MGPERVIQEALEAAGDPAGAFVWRRVCRDLDGEIRIGVVAREEGVTGRAIRALVSRFPAVDWVALRLEGADEGLRPTLGAIDRLWSVHALVWATPATAPLGAEERSGMTAIVAAGAPDRRVVMLSDTDLLEKMADDPEAELSEVALRVRSLCGPGWEVKRMSEVDSFVEGLRSDQVSVSRERRRAVAGVLLRDCRVRAEQAVSVAREELGRVDSLLVAEDERLDAERKRGRRTAAHLLGAMRRHTELLLVHLRTFLHELEADLGPQIDSIPDLDVVRHTLPHWLHHVVEQWIGDRLASWRAEVLADLADLNLSEMDLARAELLVPALHPAPVRTEAGWAQRLGVTAAVGGGAALLAFGLWIPGVLALTGGIAWSALGRHAAQASTRRALQEAATDAVRQMAQDADRLLRDQIQTLENELERLGEDRATELGRAREGQRRQLEHDRLVRTQRLTHLEEVLGTLERRIVAMHAENT
jgi:hypothetical protein